MQVRESFLPFLHGLCPDVLLRRSEVGCNTKSGSGTAGLQDRLQQLVVPVGGFNKYFRASQPLGFGLQVAERFYPAGVVHGQIA